MIAQNIIITSNSMYQNSKINIIKLKKRIIQKIKIINISNIF